MSLLFGKSCFAAVAALALAGVLPAAASKPNIIFILCDDLGFGATGPTFQNERAARGDRSLPAFSTPALDRFAAEGMLLRNHYSGAPICVASRASLLLGVTQGHAGIRDNQFDQALPANHTLATVLRHAGYATAAIGKWGLQGGGEDSSEEKEDGAKAVHGSPAEWPGYPTKRGFDYYYGYVRHVDGHFHYPKENRREVWENEREVSAGLDGCYTTDLFTARAKQWIIEHRAAQAARPFFIYLALDTPHAVLAYPPGGYPAGGGLRGGIQWTGKPGAMLNLSAGRMDSWCDPAVAAATWDHDRDAATPEVPWPDVQKRSATVIRRIDAAVGDLLQLLKDLGIDDDTLVVFTSDNGPTPESYLKGNPNDPGFFGTMGPFSGIKRDTLEGGIREPTFVRWPGHIPAGRVDHTVSGQWDWLATFAEIAGVPAPAASDGISLLPTLTGRGEQRPSAAYFEYFHPRKVPAYAQFAPLHRGRQRQQMQTVHLGRYVGVRYDIRSANDDFEIYDLGSDPGQAINLAPQPGFTSVQSRMKARVLQMRRPDPAVPRPYDEAFIPAVTAEGRVEGRITRQTYRGNFPWVPEYRTLPADATDQPDVLGVTALPAGIGGLAFVGYFHAASEGEYDFHVVSDGGVELFLHDARVIDDDFARTGVEASGKVRLAAGWHPLRLYYRKAAESPRLEFTFASPGQARRSVDAQVLAALPSSP